MKSNIDPRRFPALYAYTHAKRYALPNHLAHKYPNQDTMMDMTLDVLFTIRYTQTVAYLYNAFRMGGPTIYVEEDLGQMLVNSFLPEETFIEDIKFPWPSFRLVLPKRLLSSVYDVQFIDISFAKHGDVVYCPEGIYKDLNNLKNYDFPKSISFEKSLEGKSGIIMVNGFLDPDFNRYFTFSCTFDENTKLGAFKNSSKTFEETTGLTTEEMNKIYDRIMCFAMNAVLLCSAVPVQYETEHVQRKARKEGKRIIPALVNPHWMGDQLVSARKHGRAKDNTEPTSHVSPHWRRAHWRRQPYGKGLKERKLIWILPMHIGKTSIS
jgi:hypothetical protein